jgi:hypothetical protein
VKILPPLQRDEVSERSSRCYRAIDVRLTSLLWRQAVVDGGLIDELLDDGVEAS